ncbi:MAG TPA: hypothetical protein VGE26_05085 [Sphingobacteriaceae bacterium]
MYKYANKSGNSCVDSYQIGDNYIIVSYTSGSVYAYTYRSAGVTNVETMKSYALLGKGLSSFIRENVKDRYSKKLL